MFIRKKDLPEAMRFAYQKGDGVHGNYIVNGSWIMTIGHNGVPNFDWIKAID